MHYTEKCPNCGGSSVVIPTVNGVQRVCCEGALLAEQAESQALVPTPALKAVPTAALKAA